MQSKRTYVILCKDKKSLSTKEVKVSASSEQEAKRIVEGRGQTFIKFNNIIS